MRKPSSLLNISGDIQATCVSSVWTPDSFRSQTKGRIAHPYLYAKRSYDAILRGREDKIQETWGADLRLYISIRSTKQFPPSLEPELSCASHRFCAASERLSNEGSTVSTTFRSTTTLLGRDSAVCENDIRRIHRRSDQPELQCRGRWSGLAESG